MSNQVLYVIEAYMYHNRVIEIVEEYKDRNIVYVTTNKTNSSLRETFLKRGLDDKKLFFVDCISKQFQGADSDDRSILIDGPQSLTHINIAIDESIKKIGSDAVVILDSLSVLLIYNDSATLSKFMNFLLNKLREAGVDAAIFVIDSDAEKDAVKQVMALVDEVRESALR